MNKIAHEIYFDKIRWILTNLDQLELTADELVVILSIVVLKEQSKVVSIESIAKLTSFSKDDVDQAITLLASKRYLEIKICAGEVSFKVDNIFKLQKQVNDKVKDLFKIFEEEFKRLLTQTELRQLNEWVNLYSRDTIIEALRNASIMDKLHFNYINRILENQANE